MKILLDENCEGAYDTLKLKEYENVYKVTEIRSSMEDRDVIAYARDNNMILVTKDKTSGKKCELEDVQHILLEDAILYKFILDNLEKMKMA